MTAGDCGFEKAVSRYGADLGRLRGEIKRMEKNSCFHPGLSNGEKWEASRK